MTREKAIAHGKEQLEVFGGEHAEFIKLAIEALEQEPCEDAVSREAAQEAVESIIAKYIPILIGRYERIPLELAMAIKDLPPVTPKGVTVTDFADKCRECGKQKKGKWEFVGDNCFKCTKCGEVYTLNQFNHINNYCDGRFPKGCPNCASEMESEK